MNKKYLKLIDDKKGSDNFTQRATQTFNYQTKQKEQQSTRVEKYDGGCFAAIWDLYDASLQEQLSDYEILQVEIKRNTEKELIEYLKNPFCLLSTDMKALLVHTKQEIPGAAEALAKEKKEQTGRTGKGTTNLGGTQIGGGYTLSGVDKEESIRESSSTNSKLLRNPTKKQHGIDQSQVSKVSKQNAELNESETIKEAIKEAQNALSAAEVKVLKNGYFIYFLIN